jgi:predicted O-methyltransferase YrrM
MENLNEQLEVLFNTKRMGHVDTPATGSNSVRGLYDMIKNRFKPNFIMVEIGSFHGTSTRLFSLFVDKVYSVDCYDYPVPPTGRIPSHDQTFIDAERIFIERTSHIENIIKIRKSGADAALDFEDKSLDAVYIDAEHDYNSILSDVSTWKSKIKSGGILCGHDFSVGYITQILQSEGVLNELETYADDSWSVIIK